MSWRRPAKQRDSHSNLPIRHKLRRLLRFRPLVTIFQPRRLRANLILRWNGGGDKNVAADDGAFADVGFSAEDRGAGVNGDVVLDRGMAFLSAQHLAKVR